MQFPIHIGLHRSRFLHLFLMTIVLLSVATILAYPQTLSLRLPVLLLLGMTVFRGWRGLRLQLSALRLERSGTISFLPVGSGDYVEALLLSEAIVHRWLIIVRLKTSDNRQYSLIAAPDSMSRQEFRRLRLFLRWRADFSEPADDA